MITFEYSILKDDLCRNAFISKGSLKAPREIIHVSIFITLALFTVYVYHKERLAAVQRKSDVRGFIYRIHGSAFLCGARAVNSSDHIY